MDRFKSKPKIVNAYQFRIPSDRPTKPCADRCQKGVRWRDFGSMRQHPYVVTIHGQDTHVEDGDWLIDEGDGIHFYPCKPDVFAKSYERE